MFRTDWAPSPAPLSPVLTGTAGFRTSSPGRTAGSRKKPFEPFCACNASPATLRGAGTRQASAFLQVLDSNLGGGVGWGVKTVKEQKCKKKCKQTSEQLHARYGYLVIYRLKVSPFGLERFKIIWGEKKMNKLMWILEATMQLRDWVFEKITKKS